MLNRMPKLEGTGPRVAQLFDCNKFFSDELLFFSGNKTENSNATMYAPTSEILLKETSCRRGRIFIAIFLIKILLIFIIQARCCIT